MADRVELALEALQKMRSGAGQWPLSAPQRAEMNRHLGHLERAFAQRSTPAYGDAYARLLGTPADLNPGPPPANPSAPSAPPPPASPPPAPPGTAQIGERAASALESVNFPAFIASLVTGTFQAIVDASTRQIKEYANLVASLSQSVESFS